jgi:hypothetical protein
MNWQRKGKIFDPTSDSFFVDLVGYAQSPQVLHLSDGHRVYFSTRVEDGPGKFKSVVGFVDFDLDFSSIQGRGCHDVIPLGELGSFDEHGIFPFSPTAAKGQVLAYTCGWSRRVSVSVETSTGLAMSNDGGRTFKKLGLGPIFSSALNEPFLVGDSFVRFYEDIFHMWYIYGTKWIDNQQTGSPERVYKIGYARSSNGVEWQRVRQGIISDKIGDEECQALPSVAYWKGQYHMVFCYRHPFDFRTNPEKGYRLGYAVSSNLRDWQRNDSALDSMLPTRKDDWDAGMMCYPHLFAHSDKLYLLYNGNQFGKFGFGLAAAE